MNFTLKVLFIFALSAWLVATKAVAQSLSDSFYCNGDMQVLIGGQGDPEILNQMEQGFELQASTHERIRISINGKQAFLTIRPFDQVQWNKEGDEFPAKFKFSTDRKNWFAIEAAQASDHERRHLFCQRDEGR